MTVLDSTDPATILNIERSLPMEHTLFIVASKSGTTAEPLAFADYFYDKLRQIKGAHAGDNFCVITDPGSHLLAMADSRHFRKSFLNYADIGGRYSALSCFGLVPAALMGIDVHEFLARGLRMMHACGANVRADKNDGVMLGAALGELAQSAHRNKVTFLLPDEISTLGMWLEQLLAESTGKQSTGLLPVVGEPLGALDTYGDDRVFVYIRMRNTMDASLERFVSSLHIAGQPVITILLDDLMDLGQEFIRWEIATATIGAILGINAFNQPNVQESKDNTNRLLAVVRDQGALPNETPSVINTPLQFFFDGGAPTVEETLQLFFEQTHPGDYLAVMAYLCESNTTNNALQEMRTLVRDHLHIATTVGYGPRFLHSTGQFHKGGPNSGLFLQLTADDAVDIQVSGAPYTFGVFKRAQALGDLEALRKHGRRAGRIHLGADTGKGLAMLNEVLNRVLHTAGVNS